MSRIGKQPVAIPAGVKVNIDGSTIKVEGPKGKLQFSFHPSIKVVSDGKQITVQRPDDTKQSRALHGTTRAIVNNLIHGVSKGYEKRLKVEGVGYQAASKNKGVELTVGFANRIVHIPDPNAQLTVTVPDPTTIVVSGPDKQKVGQFAAEVRASKKPEPYKGKGVRYENEVVRRKEGKSFASGK